MDFKELTDEFVEITQNILGESLTGIYLHGSLAMGCFNPLKSDIDLIVIIEQEISDIQKMKLLQNIVHLNKKAPEKGLEISVVKRCFCNPFVYPTPFELHFSPVHLEWFSAAPQDYISKMNGTDKDLAAHFMIINRYEVTLCGKSAEEVFAEIPRQCYVDSICGDVEDARKDIISNPVYITLNLCRIISYLEEGLVLSKKGGGEWGLKHLPPEFHSVISDALDCYKSGGEIQSNKALRVMFADEMLSRISELLQN